MALTFEHIILLLLGLLIACIAKLLWSLVLRRFLLTLLVFLKALLHRSLKLNLVRSAAVELEVGILFVLLMLFL